MTKPETSFQSACDALPEQLFREQISVEGRPVRQEWQVASRKAAARQDRGGVRLAAAMLALQSERPSRHRYRWSPGTWGSACRRRRHRRPAAPAAPTLPEPRGPSSRPGRLSFAQKVSASSQRLLLFVPIPVAALRSKWLTSPQALPKPSSTGVSTRSSAWSATPISAWPRRCAFKRREGECAISAFATRGPPPSPVRLTQKSAAAPPPAWRSRDPERPIY